MSGDRTHRPLRRAARAVALVAAVLALALAPASPASAHAELTSTNPADGGVEATAPKEVTLQFSEDVAVQADGVRILDGNGERVDAGTATASGDTVTAKVDGTLSKGGYVVAWRVLSADGHPVRGAFSFSVGTKTAVRSGLADEAFKGSSDRRDDVVGAVLRGLTYLAVLVASGAVLIGSALRRPDEPSPVTRLVGALAGLGIATLLLQLPIQAALATGRGWGSISESGVLDLALSDGVGWSVAITGLALVAVLVTTGLPFKGAARLLALAGAASAPLGFVVTGHTRTMTPLAVAYVADAAHLLAASIWLGGLGALLVVLRRRRAAGDGLGAGAAVATFSGWAGAIVAAVVVAGTVLGWIEVGGLHALTTTTYGRLLLLKVGLVALVLAGAAWNRFRLVPTLADADADADADAPAPTDSDRTAEVAEQVLVAVPADRAAAGPLATGFAPPPATPTVHGAGDLDDGEPSRTWALLTRVVRLEVLGLVLVLAVTAVLTNVTPARTAAKGGVVTVSAPLGTGSVEVIIDPASPGRNDIHAYVLDADGGADDQYDAAAFQLDLPAQDLGPFDRTPVRAGAGHFQLVGTPLDLAGEWTLTITVKPDRFTEQTATVRFRVR
ncbi:copper resistance protein CopC/CopD [Aquihabitans sp. G128]|uniref:copper resistance CopC/CopD family protein n=1 Tax=Aquihabitans sp. G128 TaxID=2849779 RepID=UPI001C21D315|nr:copper resistance protein CopC [Aquihabitans sp. G128]QXC62886.1 copper resistance protein CopC/CopD [Aquihabitans sp. G128]